MRFTTKFKPSVDGLESREVLSALTITPNFIRIGHPAPVQAGPGLFTPLNAVGSHFPGQGVVSITRPPAYLLFGHAATVPANPGPGVTPITRPPAFLLFGHAANVTANPGHMPVGSQFPSPGGTPVAGLPPFLLFGHSSNVR